MERVLYGESEIRVPFRVAAGPPGRMGMLLGRRKPVGFGLMGWEAMLKAVMGESAAGWDGLLGELMGK